jgi:hypothetical protein
MRAVRTGINASSLFFHTMLSCSTDTCPMENLHVHFLESTLLKLADFGPGFLTSNG